MMKKRLSALSSTLFILLLCIAAYPAGAQRITTLEVDLSGEKESAAIPVHIALDDITALPDSVLGLYELQGNRSVAVPFQVENKDDRNLYWIVKKNGTGEKKKTFELRKQHPLQQQLVMQASRQQGRLVLSAGDHQLIQYNYATVYPPAGVDTVFKRSGFIHPLWSPNGQPLTRLSPRDHYHHFGIWNPWTKMVFESDTVDLWNLAGRKGTVRFANFVSVAGGPVFSEYEALHEHVVFKKGGGEKVALNELQSVRVYQPEKNAPYYIADITIRMNCASASPVLIAAYRYAGLGWRATEKWDNKNSETLTSEGKTRKDADGTKARWCIVQGSIDDDYAGIVMMSYPTNYNHPEPLRIWPENSNGRGDVFANFSPTKDKDWLLEPGKDYLLKYRFLVYNGRFDKEKAEIAWRHFAHAPQVKIKSINTVR